MLMHQKPVSKNTQKKILKKNYYWRVFNDSNR